MKRVIFFLASLALAASLAAEEGQARIITSVDRAVQCIASISVYSLDGQLANMNSMGFDLEPGRHTLQGRAKINAQNCPPMRGNESRDVPPLEYEFEAGKTYYVGLDHSSRNRAEWNYVVWKVEDSN